MTPGKEVQLGDKKFIIPPITLGQLRAGLLDKIKEGDKLAENGDTFGTMDKRADVILAALRRNYSETDLSDSEFFDRLDLSNFSDAWAAALGFSPGETGAATADGTTSMGSTLPSPPPMDGTTESSTS